MSKFARDAIDKALQYKGEAEQLRAQLAEANETIAALSLETDNAISLQAERNQLRRELAKANESVKELERELASKELLHVGFTNGSQVKYAKTEEGAFYPDTSGDCYIPLYMLKSHEHRIDTTSIEQLRKEQELWAT